MVLIDRVLLEHTTEEELRIQDELRRLRKIRQQQGDEAWAKALALIIVDELNFQTIRNKEATEYSKQLLKALAPHLEELHSHPTLGNGFVAVLIEGLCAWHNIGLDSAELMMKRTAREAHIRHRD